MSYNTLARCEVNIQLQSLPFVKWKVNFYRPRCETYSGKVNGLSVNSNACLNRRNSCSDWRACRERDNQINERTNERSPDRTTDRTNEQTEKQRRSERTNEQTRCKSSRSAMAKSAFFFSYKLPTEIRKIAYHRYRKDAFLWQIKKIFSRGYCKPTLLLLVYQISVLQVQPFQKISICGLEIFQNCLAFFVRWFSQFSSGWGNVFNFTDTRIQWHDISWSFC